MHERTVHAALYRAMQKLKKSRALTFFFSPKQFLDKNNESLSIPRIRLVIPTSSAQ